jgi:hypothetical protein
MSNCEFDELTIAKLILSKYIYDFVIYKYTISLNFDNILYFQMYFWGGHTTRLHGKHTSGRSVGHRCWQV